MKATRKRILFVDDDPSFLDGLRRVLHGQRHVWDMAFVPGVDEAIAEMGKGAFDAIVTDVKMPGKDGFELLRVIHDSETHRDVPVIMLTGLGENELKALALNLGANDLLSKPVGEEDLLARLRSALHLKTVQDALKEVNATLEAKVAERTSELEQSRLDIIWRLAKAGEHRDEGTGSHIVRVGCYARLIAESLGLPRDSVEFLFLTTPLHDIGKIGIPDAILRKPGPLTPEERRTMQDHCVIGAEILLQEPKGMRPFLEWRGERSVHSLLAAAGNRILAMAASIAMTHHERWDGKGYPMGLSGDDIPLNGRIAGVADVYDALCSHRPYKEAFPEEESLAILKADSGKHFDPAVVSAFNRVFKEARAVRAEFPDESLAPAGKEARP
jgi:response regulator RpfG family c-di-GMP phosphodiesterase